MTTQIIPRNTKIYAGEIKKERKSESGIILEGVSSVKETAAANVIAVGPDVKDLVAGDVVYLDWAKTKLVVVDGVQRVIVDEEDVMAIVG